MKNIYIGIDGGGTKTKAIITDENFKTIGTGLGGASNIRLSVTDAWSSIYCAINEALKGTGITLDDREYEFHSGMGLAGVSILKAKKEFLETPHPFRTLILESDAHIGCLAAHDGKDGAIISVGTGVIGYLIEKGKNYRVGGWGFPHADIGGGAWMGLEAAKLTFKAIDAAIEFSSLPSDIFKKFDGNLSDFVTWANAAKSSDFATLAPFVIDRAQKGDVLALKLIKASALEVDTMYNCLCKKVKNTSTQPKCAILGGLGKYIYPHIKKNKHIFMPDTSKTAELGAIYMLQQNLSLSFHQITKIN